MRLALIAAVAVVLAAPAQAAGLMSYGMATADAELVSGGHAFSIYVHPKEDLLLIQPKLSEMGARPATWPIDVWRAAAEALVTPVGCGIPSVAVKTRNGASWEATYVCPEGVDLRALVLAQRATLRARQPLHR